MREEWGRGEEGGTEKEGRRREGGMVGKEGVRGEERSE